MLTTQSLLCAAGLTQGGSAATGAALAGTLNWVLKDGIGQLAAVVSASLISDRFDTDAKRWRMTAAGCENGARALESSPPRARVERVWDASGALMGREWSA